MRKMKNRLLTSVVFVLVSILLLYPVGTVFATRDITLESAREREEDAAVDGDLEGPDYIPPPKYYRTLEMMLREKRARGPPPAGVSGTREILVLLVEFSDVAHDPTHTVAHFNDRFFDTTPPSVRDFYDENSYGIFTYVPGAVMGWYTSTSTQASYIGPPMNHYPVFQEAIGDVDPFFNFGPYDTDNNGVVENEELTLFMIVSGDQGGAFHTWNRPNIATADTNALGNPVSVEGEYSVTHEERHIGSYCHELGHDLGLPDLYDTDPWDGVTITGTSEGIGNYGLMGGGSWTFSHMTAWSKIQLGWITPTIITSNGYYTIQDAETHAEAYVLRDSAYSTTEYFLIENRHPANSFYETVGWPVAPSGTYPDSGIVIYHIDETKMQDWIASGINNVNRDETHKGVDVECADNPTSHVINADDLDAGVNRGDANDLWDNTEYDFHDTSNPCNANWYVMTTSGMDVRALPAPGSAMIVALSIEDVWPPEADANGPYLGNEGTPVTFDGSDSFDLNGFITAYAWDLDGDGVYDDATGATPSHTWFDDYSGAIGLKVTDNEGLDDTDSTTVTIQNVAPTVDAGPDQMVNEGDTVSFSGFYADPGTGDTHTIEWDFGEGSTTSGTLTPTHVYGDNGDYLVTLTVTDDDGGVGTDTLTITVNNVAPSIAPFGPFTADEGTPVTLTATSTDPGSDDLTFTWVFELGPTITSVYYNDGVGSDPYQSPWGTYPFSATDVVAHTYGDNDVYTVTLTVEDDDGGVCVSMVTVTVNNVAPTASIDSMDQPNPQFILPIVHTLTFTGSFGNPGWLDTHTAMWDFGDGTVVPGTLTEENVEPDATGTTTADHVYSAPGTYTVTLTVTDDDGGVGTDTWQVVVLGAQEAKDDINEYIQSLPDTAFDGNPVQRRKAFDNKFAAIDDMLEDEEYKGAIQDLRDNIRGKTDGFVDGNPKNDWILDVTAQQEICMKIDDLIAYLETFL